MHGLHHSLRPRAVALTVETEATPRLPPGLLDAALVAPLLLRSWSEELRASGVSLIQAAARIEAVSEMLDGARGRVRTPVGGWLPFEVTAVEPGHRWSWRVGGVPATGHRVDPLGATRSRLVIEVPWWAAPYVVVCRVALRRLAVVAEELAAADT